MRACLLAVYTAKLKFLRPDTHNRATPLSSAHPHSAALSQQRRLTRTAGRHRRTNSKRSGSRARWRQEDARARHASRQLRAQRAGQGHAPEFHDLFADILVRPPVPSARGLLCRFQLAGPDHYRAGAAHHAWKRRLVDLSSANRWNVVDACAHRPSGGSRTMRRSVISCGCGRSTWCCCTALRPLGLLERARRACRPS